MPEAPQRPSARQPAPAEAPAERVAPEDLPPRARQILGRLPEQERAELITLVWQELYSGPLPHPNHFDRFADRITNGADRIMAMAEREQSHRHAMEAGNQSLDQTALAAEIRYSMLGMQSGVIIGALFLAAAVALAWLNHPWLAAACLGPPLFGVIRKVIDGKKPQPAAPAPQPQKTGKRGGR